MNEIDVTVDMHVHPKECWSCDQKSRGDGPGRIVADLLGLEKRIVVACTEHDTVVTYEATVNELKHKGNRGLVEVVPGVEATSIYRGFSTHILAYWLKQTGESAKDLIEFMLRASEDILIATSDAQYWKYAYAARENAQKWRKGERGYAVDDSDRLTIGLLESIRDSRYPDYDFEGWRISPHTRPGSATLTALNHVHIAEAMKELGWVGDEQKVQKELLERGRPLYPCKANGNDLGVIEDRVSTEKVVEGLHKARCLVVFAHPQELIRAIAEERIINELGYKKLIKDDEQPYDFESREGVEYNDLSDVLRKDSRCLDIINGIIDEIWGLTVSLSKRGLRGLELYNRFSYADEAMEYATQQFEVRISEFNREHPLTPLIVTAGSDNHDGLDDKKRPLGMLLRQRQGVNRELWQRDNYRVQIDATTLYERIERRPIELSVLTDMQGVGLSPDTGLYLTANGS